MCLSAVENTKSTSSKYVHAVLSTLLMTIEKDRVQDKPSGPLARSNKSLHVRPEFVLSRRSGANILLHNHEMTLPNSSTLNPRRISLHLGEGICFGLDE